MSKLPKERRQQLILVVVITAVVLAGLWFGVIAVQQQSILKLADDKTQAKVKLDSREQQIKNAEVLEAQSTKATKELAELENDMAPSGDPYAWLYSKIKEFKAQYKVEIPQLSQPVVSEVDILPKFPYKQATFAVGGTAYFHELGKFLADFENHFPYFRVQNLDVQTALSVEDKEKLTFRFDLVTLVKPGA
jgi:hypothetical protein